MKKNGFTLAEVLITLTIIGVIATMTLPALMTNTQEQQAKTALKKGINTLTEAAQLSQAIDGISYADLTVGAVTSSDIVAQPSLYALLVNRTQYDPSKSGTSRLGIGEGAAAKNTANYALFFRDGTALSFPTALANNTTTSAIQSDGLPKGLSVVFDTNGLKGPNVISNCNKVTLGTTNEPKDDGTVAGLNTKCSSDNRVIRDQFPVRLRAGFAVPNSPAARWAFEN